MSQNREILVLQIGGEEIRLAAARCARDKVEISNAASFPCQGKSSDNSVLRDQNILDAIKAHVDENGWARREVVCLISGSNVACQHYDMPPLKADALRQAVTLKLAQQLHFDVGSAVVAVDSPRSTGAQVRVNAVALHQDTAQSAVDAVEALNLQLLALSAAPSALACLASASRKATQGHQAVLFVDENVSTLLVLDGDRSYVTTELPIGGADFTAALMRPIIAGQQVIQLDQAGAMKLRDEVGIPAPGTKIESIDVTGDRLLPLLEPVLQKITKQITQWLAFASTCNGGIAIKSLTLVGPGAAIGGIGPALASRLSIDVGTKSWLADKASMDAGSSPIMLDRYAFAVAAAMNWDSLPDLIPPRVQKQRKIRRIRGSITRCAPFVAAAMLLLAVSFDSLQKQLQLHEHSERLQSDALNQIVQDNLRWAGFRGRTRALAGQIDEFVRCTPPWQAIFKELSSTLPSDLRAIEFACRPGESGTKLFVKAAVYSDSSSRSFDEVAGQAVLTLQKSPFFRRVEMSANRGAFPEDPQAAGTVSFEMDVVYPKGKAKA
jgi:Tfp pilus assembly PilM family ATPase